MTALPTAPANLEASATVVLTLADLHDLITEVAQQATKAALTTLTAAATQPSAPAAAVAPVPEPSPDGWPLAELAAGRRAELCLSLAEVARRMERAAQAEGDWCAATMQSVSAVERQGRVPQPANLRWLAVALKVPPERLSQAAQQQQLRKRDAMAAQRQGFAQRRKSLGWSQEALAHRLGVERSTVVRWERGATDPQPWVRPRIASALECSPEQLDVLLATGNPAVSSHAGVWRR